MTPTMKIEFNDDSLSLKGYLVIDHRPLWELYG